MIETFARALGLDVAGPEDAAAGPIDADTFELACASGYLASLTADGRPRFVIAARGPAIRRLAASRRGRPRTRSFAIAGPRAFLDLASARAGGGLSARAAEGPAATVPELSVVGGMPRVGRGAQAGVLLIAALVVAAAIFAPGVWATLLLLGGLVFATSNGFRLMLALTPPAEAPRRLWSDDASLPVYTVMAALHREAAVVPSLLDAIERLDYPALGSNGTTTPRASTAATR
ncbi:hypothetical protein [Chenggangzhangella methanolivorans]|uniref:Uncharacterized protein n=1 Tax=Chenggangzhangella methanolivorans TaxID=1437009 RepID=A0A9E6R6I0_9HYPH|nr:hypothetical protein [Chenggangzhangella methanolivorans]QZN99155.1 hypothetical protein K6K41_20290 [Chenggangzhangella methanolivorans]